MASLSIPNSTLSITKEVITKVASIEGKTKVTFESNPDQPVDLSASDIKDLDIKVGTVVTIAPGTDTLTLTVYAPAEAKSKKSEAAPKKTGTGCSGPLARQIDIFAR